MINAPHAHSEKKYLHISTSPKSFVELPSYSCYLFVDLSVLEAYSDICAEISEMLRTSTNTTCDSAHFFSELLISTAPLSLSVMCIRTKSTFHMPAAIAIYFQFALCSTKRKRFLSS